MATADGLQEVLHAAAYGDDPVVLDFSAVKFMDSSGLRALLQWAGSDDCGPVVIKDPSPRSAASSRSPSRTGRPAWRVTPNPEPPSPRD